MRDADDEPPGGGARHAGSGQEERGQSHAVYRPFLLRFYDLVVYVYNSPFLWRCPAFEMRRQYERNVGAQHLEVGVGTGYLLDSAHLPRRPAITLLDVNPGCLRATARRLRRWGPDAVRASVLEPFPEMGAFDSAAMNFVVHCLPGSMRRKGVAFASIARCLAPDGVFFGATILQGDAPRSTRAQRWMDLYNRRGIFCNADDTLEGLRAALQAAFADVTVRMRGCVALWEARRPRGEVCGPGPCAG